MKVAVLGCGSVGSQVVRLLLEQADDLEARVGASVELAGVAVRRPDLQRDAYVPAGLLTTDAAGLVASGVDLVIEVIGGGGTAYAASTVLTITMRTSALVVAAGASPGLQLNVTATSGGFADIAGNAWDLNGSDDVILGAPD